MARRSNRLRIDAYPVLRAKVEQALASLVDDGATLSDALASLVELGAEAPAILVVDLVE